MAQTQRLTAARYIKRDTLQALAFGNSPRLPRTINDDGIRREWVGIGWLDCGYADGTEHAIVESSGTPDVPTPEK